MNRINLAIHRLLQAVGILSFIGSIAFFLMKWGSLPENAGIHFDGKGYFDVYAERIYGFYPHIFMLISLAVNIVITQLAIKGRIKLGLKVTEKGSTLIMTSMIFALDFCALAVICYFVMWSWCVSTQTQGVLVGMASVPLSISMTVCLAAGIFQCIVYNICKENKADIKKLSAKEKRMRAIRFILTGNADKADGSKHHQLFRIISWIIIAMMLLIISFVAERLPSEDLTDYYHGLAYFANVDAYLPKWIVFMFFIGMVPFMAIFEVIGIQSKKAGDNPKTVLADRLKVIFAVFCAWFEIKICGEEKLTFTEGAVFFGLCIINVIRYFIEKMLDGQTKE